MSEGYTTSQMRAVIDDTLTKIQTAYPGISRASAMRVLRTMSLITVQPDMTDEAFQWAFFDRLIDGTEEREEWALQVTAAIHRKDVEK